MAFKEDLTAFICEGAGLEPGGFDDETLLFSRGFIDSFTMASDVTLENFDTVSRIVAFVGRLERT